MSRLPKLLAVTGASAALVAGAASGQGPTDPNPCHGPKRHRLLCPNLQMSPPGDIYVEHTHGRVLLHGQNSINSVGRGPAELHGRRDGSFMRARQVIHKKDGGRLVVNTHARLAFKHIPGQGGYWKFRHAGLFELWKVDKSGHPIRRVRTGEKQNYCLRDLFHTHPGLKRSPKSFVYPGCNQDPHKQQVTLGTSVGWSDVYPSHYYEQYIDVTGLKGRYGFFQVADPRNGIWETHEDDNAGETVVRLPSGKVLMRRGKLDRPHAP